MWKPAGCVCCFQKQLYFPLTLEQLSSHAVSRKIDGPQSAWNWLAWYTLKPSETSFWQDHLTKPPFSLIEWWTVFTEVIVRFSLSHFCGEVTIEEPTPTLLSRVVLNSVYASAVNHQPEKARPVAGNDCKVFLNMCHGRCWLPQRVSFWHYMKILSQSLMLSAFGIVLSLTTGFPGSLNQLLLGSFFDHFCHCPS